MSAKTYLGAEAEIAGLLNNGGAFGVKLDKSSPEIAKRGKDAGLSLSELTAVTTPATRRPPTPTTSASSRKLLTMWRCPSPACQGTGGPSTRWSWTGRRTTLPASCFPSAWRKELSPPRSTNTEPPRKGIADQGRAGRFRVLPGPVQAGRTVWAGADYNNAAGIAGRQSPQERRHFRKNTSSSGWKLQQLESSRSWNDGIARASLSYVSTATDAAGQMENLFTNAFQTISSVGGSALEQVFNEGVCGG